MKDLPPQIRERMIAKARTLIEALPFMQDHRGKVVVIKYGGAAMDRAPLVRPFAEDVGLLLHSGIHPVIVHGGGAVSHDHVVLTRDVDRLTDPVDGPNGLRDIGGLADFGLNEDVRLHRHA